MAENKVATFELDTDDLEGMRKLMDNLGPDPESVVYSSVNEDGETIHISIFTDRIVTRVFQGNGWIRRNIYHYDGTVEELFVSRWKGVDH